MTTKTKMDSKSKGLCHYDSLTRTKFFHGMLLTDEHLRAEQTYHREALKRMNRHLWGAGIVCGLGVYKAGGSCIRIDPGMALDCRGNVIELCKTITMDLAEVCKEKYPDGCMPEDADPITKYLVLRYTELPADPEPVLTPSDDCTPGEGTKCEPSKYREGFCIELRDECPDRDVCVESTGGVKGLVPTLVTLFRQDSEEYDPRSVLEELTPPCMESPPCPRCECDDCAVGIATVVVNCATRKVDEVTCGCRAYIWSPRYIQWLICRLLAGVDKLGDDLAGLPNEHAVSALTLSAVWRASAIVAGRGRTRERSPEAGVKSAGREKGGATKTKTPKE
jgi:hypothetical protein